MSKKEFMGDLTHFGKRSLRGQCATFKNMDEAYEALNRYAQIHGIQEVIVIVKD